MKLQNRNRAMLYALVGGYLIYLAYEMIRVELAGESAMPMWLCILCAVLMAAAGVAILVLSWKTNKAKDEEETNEPEDPKGMK